MFTYIMHIFITILNFYNKFMDSSEYQKIDVDSKPIFIQKSNFPLLLSKFNLFVYISGVNFRIEKLYQNTEISYRIR